MPYTRLSNREILNPQIDALRNALRGIISDNPETSFEELMSYVFLTLINDSYKKDISSIVEVVGLLELVKFEYNRTITTNYVIQNAFETEY